MAPPALLAIEKETPDLILLDMRLPVMDGWHFVHALRARGRVLPPIVVLTASADAARAAREVGACGALGKPFDADELVSIVQECLSVT